MTHCFDFGEEYFDIEKRVNPSQKLQRSKIVGWRQVTPD